MGTFDPETWARVPFHFWTGTMFILGCMVGSFLNVCIHRMPRGESIVRPPSHCPHCGYSIPWYLNIPLITWLFLRGRCANCKAPISIRYFLVELLTGLMFMACWLKFGERSALLALVYSFLIAGLIAATFIDIEHFIIPDEITIGGMVVGVICSFLVPMLQVDFPSMTPAKSAAAAMRYSFLGMAVGGGLVYAVLRIGKLMFGRQKIALTPRTRIIFGETSLRVLEEEYPYEDLFYRPSDTVKLHAHSIELVDRCYANVDLSLRTSELRIGEETFNPEEVRVLEAVTDEIVLPREAMGLGDVKFMAAIGAFLGWPATVFSLALSSIIGAAVGLLLIGLKRKEWSNRLPYGPYIALAAVIWVFGGWDWLMALGR